MAEAWTKKNKKYERKRKRILEMYSPKYFAKHFTQKVMFTYKGGKKIIRDKSVKFWSLSKIKAFNNQIPEINEILSLSGLKVSDIRFYESFYSNLFSNTKTWISISMLNNL